MLSESHLTNNMLNLNRITFIQSSKSRFNINKMVIYYIYENY
jgi:hypothetical protein